MMLFVKRCYAVLSESLTVNLLLRVCLWVIDLTQPLTKRRIRLELSRFRGMAENQSFFSPMDWLSYLMISWSEAYQALACECQDFLFFELAKVFAPFGKIYSFGGLSAVDDDFKRAGCQTFVT